MKTIGKLILAAVFILTTVSCKKGDSLPKASQKGANMMAARIDGKVWQKKACWSCIGGGSGLSVNYNDQGLSILGQQKNEIYDITIEIFVLNIVNTGKYELTGRAGNPSYTNYARLNNYQNDTEYYTTANQKGSVLITKIDRSNKIVSGTFEFTAEDEKNPGKTIRVTDGWFDVTYH